MLSSLLSEMNVIREKMDDKQEEMQDLVASLAFWMDVNQQGMKSMLDISLE
jgi:hypothetical protein